MTSTLTFGEAVQLRVAVADQQHTMQRIAALGSPSTHVGQPHPWYQSLGEGVVRQLAEGTARVCPHLGPGRGLGPMYVVLGGPLRVQCRLCFVARRRLSPVDDATCDRCSVYTRDGVLSGAIPIGPLLLIFGVCRPCGTDLGAVQQMSTP